MVHYKIKSTTHLKKLMNAYTNSKEALYNSFRFIYDGHRIQNDDTAKSLEMQDMDIIDAFVFQLGGR